MGEDAHDWPFRSRSFPLMNGAIMNSSAARFERRGDLIDGMDVGEAHNRDCSGLSRQEGRRPLRDRSRIGAGAVVGIYAGGRFQTGLADCSPPGFEAPHDCFRARVVDFSHLPVLRSWCATVGFRPGAQRASHLGIRPPPVDPVEPPRLR